MNINVEMHHGICVSMQHYACQTPVSAISLLLSMGECDSTFLKSRTPRITVLDNYR